jgi:hypothetical protein
VRWGLRRVVSCWFLGSMGARRAQTRRGWQKYLPFLARTFLSTLPPRLVAALGILT